MYNTSKYYSCIFYADRNVRPWTILGYTLATFPKVTQYIYLCTTREEIRTLAQLQEKGPCIILREPGSCKIIESSVNLLQIICTQLKHFVLYFQWIKSLMKPCIKSNSSLEINISVTRGWKVDIVQSHTPPLCPIRGQ